MDHEATALPRAHRPDQTGHATIYDIARVAGVSPSTVSRALNKPGRINATTEQRIREVAESLGYRLNPMARALYTGQTSTFALILSDITNPVYFELVRGAETVGARENYTMVLAESQESGTREADAAERLLPAVDGIALVSTRMPDEQIRHLAARKPVVVVNRRVDDVLSIVPDPRPGIEAAIEHLAALGHRSLAYLSGPRTSYMSQLRWEIAFECALAHGLSVVEIGPCEPTLAGGRAIKRRVLAAGVTAVLAYNDIIAIGLLLECRDHGIDLPGQLSIVGFDDSFGSDFTSPPLTTIRSPLRQAGELAVERLLTLVRHGGHQHVDDLSTVLVQRGSTAAPMPT
ncbi:LacI family transcriptional regulator [Prauserella sp. PE36]|uniref:LacI family DNA-binding transcriptional regulator n=1 Tax=Prauserella sp. PE36 TaxID=1504709 RepID=UPI000DE3760B|nr:LacI family DNA-binding transcriptional regulator [Prauserella sp. PE36]RBM21866.1 LacI family transcriptional regulator [Prauserella sp. PE36]